MDKGSLTNPGVLNKRQTEQDYEGKALEWQNVYFFKYILGWQKMNKIVNLKGLYNYQNHSFRSSSSHSA